MEMDVNDEVGPPAREAPPSGLPACLADVDEAELDAIVGGVCVPNVACVL